MKYDIHPYKWRIDKYHPNEDEKEVVVIKFEVENEDDAKVLVQEMYENHKIVRELTLIFSMMEDKKTMLKIGDKYIQR